MDADASALRWHCCKQDCVVSVTAGSGWSLQIDNHLPMGLFEGREYVILGGAYYRFMRGTTNLTVEIIYR